MTTGVSCCAGPHVHVRQGRDLMSIVQLAWVEDSLEAQGDLNEFRFISSLRRKVTFCADRGETVQWAWIDDGCCCLCIAFYGELTSQKIIVTELSRSCSTTLILYNNSTYP